jgi:N-methylhydantoinase A/oxoprolinase/acetone carboxylase beta subunit
MYRIGVDVGGTNTDAVILRGREIIATQKAPTSGDVATGVTEALTALLQRSGLKAGDIGLLVIGTTRFTNAVVERRRLEPTAVVRLCLPSTQSLPPMVDWPADLAEVIGDHVYLAAGGFEFDGRPITPLDDDAIRRIGADIRSKRVNAVAICSVFASVNDASERRAAAILGEICPEADISISAGIGRIGLLERESATILNSSLLALARHTVDALQTALKDCGLACPVFISQNDGTLMSAAQVQRFPVLTFASGPTNSMRGAAFLSQCADALIIDIGGTTTDVGLLQNGFPRQAAHVVEVGGVRTNFRMPDLLSIGLGGGSIVRGGADDASIGPQSVGFEIAQKALVFGGSTITATDIAVAGGRVRLGDLSAVASLDPQLVRAALAQIDLTLENAVDRCRVSASPLPILAVGGGSILAPPRLGGLEITRLAHSEVANAIGAAIAQTSGEVDRVFSLEGSSRSAALEAAEGEARRAAIASGAEENTLVVTEREDVPLAYLPGNATRIRVKVVGDLRTDLHA